MTFIIIVGCLVAYFTIGFLLVRANAKEIWRKARKVYSGERYRRQSVKTQTMLWLTIWPFMLPTAGISSLGDHLVNRYDPERWEREAKEQRKQMARQQQHITELERELGIR